MLSSHLEITGTFSSTATLPPNRTRWLVGGFSNFLWLSITFDQTIINALLLRLCRIPDVSYIRSHYIKEKHAHTSRKTHLLKSQSDHLYFPPCFPCFPSLPPFLPLFCLSMCSPSPGALQIENSEETDQGKYECVASNVEGVRYSSPANLYVRGREHPGPKKKSKVNR